MMDQSVLERHAGGEIRLWIEDVSGEEKTKPKQYTLHRIVKEDDGWIKFYINDRQFLTVPIFQNGDSFYAGAEREPYFVSKDRNAKLVYWVYFLATM